MLNSLSVMLRSVGSGDSEERKSRDEPDETEEDEEDPVFTIAAIDAYHNRRKPSVEQLATSLASLKPTFQSLHEPHGGHSPPPAFVR